MTYQQWPLGPDAFSAYARRVIQDASDSQFRETPCNEYREKARDEQHELNTSAQERNQLQEGLNR